MPQLNARTCYEIHNGSGKTSILKSMTLLLSWLIARIEREKGSGSPIADLDILNGARFSEITINLKNCNDSIAYLTYYQFDKTYIKEYRKNVGNFILSFEKLIKKDTIKKERVLNIASTIKLEDFDKIYFNGKQINKYVPNNPINPFISSKRQRCEDDV